MKKLFIMLFGLMLLTSCTNEGTKCTTDGMYGKIFSKKFEYEGHIYIEFRDVGLYGQGYVHDPNCPNTIHNKN